MTMPHLMNCEHSEAGWCLDCVKEIHDCRQDDSQKNSSSVKSLELMLYRCLMEADHYAEGRVYDCLKGDIPGLQEWLAANNNRLAIEVKKAELMEERERRRAALAEVERKIEELGR